MDVGEGSRDPYPLDWAWAERRQLEISSSEVGKDKRQADLYSFERLISIMD